MKKKWFKDNRGAALISVMIAVAFISILASTLLYMSYSNYKMKVVNYESKVNFYGTEHDLTVMSTGIRNEVATASDPLKALQDAVGFVSLDAAGNGRYNPSKLANIVYPTYGATSTETNVTLLVDENRQYDSGNPNAYTVAYHTDVPGASVANYLVDTTSEPGITKVTLKGIKLTQTSLDGGYVNTITTDMVFRVKKVTSTSDAGGIGKFSVLSDNGVSTPDNVQATRIEMYGNVFLGPMGGNYAYTGTGAINPGGKDALVLTGNSSFVAYGDYMVVFGNIRLKDEALLQVIGGNLTVYGDIILESSTASVVCTGKVFFPADDKPDQPGVKYGITGTGNVLPASLKTKTEKVETDKYTELLTTLKLDDSDHNNDGILNQVLSDDARTKLGKFSTGDHAKTAETIDIFGIEYNTTVWVKDSSPLNDGDLNNNLCFMTGSNCYFGDASAAGSSQNLNTTFICLEDIKLNNKKTLRFSQVGSEVFNFMIIKSGTKGQITNTGSQSYMEYDEATHMIVDGDGVEANNTDIASLFQPGNAANEVVNKVLGLSTNGESKDPVVQTAIGYENWYKE